MNQTSIKKLLVTYKLKIPDFQRSFVWKKNKKIQLLDSLFKGFPIGAITLYEDAGAYYIIDGLQRINTLKQYLSSPAQVIGFNSFYDKIKVILEEFIIKNSIDLKEKNIKSCIKKWYEELNELYEYEKVSVLYNVIKRFPQIFEKINDLQLIEGLRDILKSKIEITHDDIALIIYKGDKEYLPELFKNINTGSVALSQYEILQSVWTDNYLDKDIVCDEYIGFNRELELIKNEYEIDALKEEGKFDIFKNIIGLNNRICCIKDSGKLFNFSAYKKILREEGDDELLGKYYHNDTIGFEIYSTILCGSANKIIKAVDLIYKFRNKDNIVDNFVRDLNNAIIEMINLALDLIKNNTEEVIESKYHSLYIIAGLIFANYDINIDTLEMKKIDTMDDIIIKCTDLKQHKKEKWFVDENRQVGFFAKKINELVNIKNDYNK